MKLLQSLKNLANKVFFGLSTERIQELNQKYPVYKDGDGQNYRRSLEFWDQIDRGEPVESPPVYVSPRGIATVHAPEILRSRKGQEGLERIKKTGLHIRP